MSFTGMWVLGSFDTRPAAPGSRRLGNRNMYFRNLYLEFNENKSFDPPFNAAYHEK